MPRPNLVMQAAVYSAVLAYLRGDREDRQQLLATLRATVIDDAVVRGGRIRDDGRLVHDMMLVQVKEPVAGGTGWDLYEVKRTIPGDQAFQSLAQSRCPLVRK